MRHLALIAFLASSACATAGGGAALSALPVEPREPLSRVMAERSAAPDVGSVRPQLVASAARACDVAGESGSGSGGR